MQTTSPALFTASEELYKQLSREQGLNFKLDEKLYIYNVSILSFFQSKVKLIPKREGTHVLSAFFSTSKKLLFHYAPQFNEIQHLCTQH